MAKKHKPASETRSRIDALREELHGLYKAVERTGSTVVRMEEIVGAIAEIQEKQYERT